LNKWDFRGPDALRAAQRVFSNDALGLEVGQARYGAFLDDEGLMIDDGTVFNTGRKDRCWVMTNGKDHQEYFAQMLEGYDVEVEWIAPRMPHLGVLGPRSREVVQKLTDADVGALRYFRFHPEPVKVGGELGYELFLTDPADATELWNTVVGAGVTPLGVEAIEILRIEAGLIVTDYDYEAHQRNPYDFNLDRFVALDQDRDFAGKEKLRAVAADPPNRFVTLKIEGDTLPEYGAPVTKDGEEIGVLTSPTDSPRFGKIGLAVVRSGHASPGTAVDVKVGESTTSATVDVLPIYDTNKQRPRA
jgi:aminomethyltransferase